MTDTAECVNPATDWCWKRKSAEQEVFVVMSPKETGRWIGSFPGWGAKHTFEFVGNLEESKTAARGRLEEVLSSEGIPLPEDLEWIQVPFANCRST